MIHITSIKIREVYANKEVLLYGGLVGQIITIQIINLVVVLLNRYPSFAEKEQLGASVHRKLPHTQCKNLLLTSENLILLFA